MKKILIITVGGSPAPVVKSLAEHCPDFIYFLPSKDTRKDIDDILSRAFPVRRYDAFRIIELADPNDLMSSYKGCCQAFEHIKTFSLDSHDIIADLTGGTKIMSAALLLAAANQGAKVSYVSGSARTKDGVGVVENGTEFVIRSHHPYDFLAKSDKEAFCINFNSYRFAAAIEDCERIIAKGDERTGKIFNALKDIAQGYQNWDLFRFDKCRLIEKGVERLQRLSMDRNGELIRLSGFIRANQNNIKYINALDFKKLSREMANDLVANALRRAEEGKYDDAIARLYRALEMVAQWCFTERFGVGTEKFPLEKLDAATAQKIWPGCNLKAKKDIACRNAFQILNIEGDEYGKLFMDSYNSKIESIMNGRNKSIMAHGLEPLSKKAFDSFYEIFAGVFKIDGKGIQFPRIEPDSLISIGLE